MPRSNNQKSRILEAAFQVVAESGASHLTIDAVADMAEVSKGGLLYHFPNKRALLNGMLETLLERFVPANTTQPERLIEHIERERHQSGRDNAVGLALLTAAGEQPELLDPARAVFAEVYGAIKDRFVDEQQAEILMLATEGIRFLRVLGLWHTSDEETDALHQRLIAMAKDLEIT